jgi:hypothetical protein
VELRYYNLLLLLIHSNRKGCCCLLSLYNLVYCIKGRTWDGVFDNRALNGVKETI